MCDTFEYTLCIYHYMNYVSWGKEDPNGTRSHGCVRSHGTSTRRRISPSSPGWYPLWLDQFWCNHDPRCGQCFKGNQKQSHDQKQFIVNSWTTPQKKTNPEQFNYSSMVILMLQKKTSSDVWCFPQSQPHPFQNGLLAWPWRKKRRNPAHFLRISWKFMRFTVPSGHLLQFATWKPWPI